MVFEILPGLVPVLRNLERDGDLDGRVLVADLAGESVVQGALDERGVLKLSEQAQRALLQRRIGRGLEDMLKLVEEGCIAILRGDGERSLAQRRID